MGRGCLGSLRHLPSRDFFIRPVAMEAWPVQAPILACLRVSHPTPSSLLPPSYLIFPDSTDPPVAFSMAPTWISKSSLGRMEPPRSLYASDLLSPSDRSLGCRPEGRFRDSALHTLLEQLSTSSSQGPARGREFKGVDHGCCPQGTGMLGKIFWRAGTTPSA